jgi:glycosyltransferase involved in cell wall biosynthesis
MRIAFDWQIFCIQSYGGVSRYFVRLAEKLLAEGHDIRIFAPLHQNRYVDDLPRATVWGVGVPRYLPKTTRLVTSMNGMAARRAIAHWLPDVVHETYYAGRPSARQGAATVVTVYDMIHEKFPEFFPRSDRTAALKLLAVKRADHVICISESTRRDLLDLSGIEASKVSVVHLGFDRMPAAVFSLGPTVENVRPFLLYVGNRQGHKNFDSFLASVAGSRDLRRDFDVVAFGGGQFSVRELQLISAHGFPETQVRQESGGDARLGALYDSAAVFVYPSHYEGFGLPLLEAMAHECPVVSSNTSSMPEIVGDAGEFFDPASPGEIAAAIERVVYSQARRADLVSRGQRRLQEFTWERCAARTLNIYRKVAAR